MKSVIIVLTCCVLMAQGKTVKEFVTDVREKMIEVGAECADKLQISTEAMKEMTSKKLPITHDGKCVISCMSQHYGLMDEQGNLQINKAQEFIAPLKEIDSDMYDKLLEISVTCFSGSEKGDVCDIATNSIKCTTDEMQKRGVVLDMMMFD